MLAVRKSSGDGTLKAGGERKKRWMRYYRFALKVGQSSLWKWHSTCLTSLDALFRYVHVYSRGHTDRFQLFFASSKEELQMMLCRHNQGFPSYSVPVSDLLRKNLVHEMKRFQLEMAESSDHDVPYIFVAPSPAQRLFWSQLKTLRKRE